MDGGFVYINGEEGGFIVDAASLKRVGFLKYGNHEAGIWRLSSQDFEIGRVGNVSDLPDTKIVAADPITFTTDLYIDAQGDVGIGIGDGSGVSGTDLARDLHISDVMRLEPRTSAPSSPATGDIYVDDSGALCFYDGEVGGTGWDVVAGAGTCS